MMLISQTSDIGAPGDSSSVSPGLLRPLEKSATCRRVPNRSSVDSGESSWLKMRGSSASLA